MNPKSQTGALFTAAFAAHRAGNLPQAEAAYRELLAQTPGHPDALHLLGVLLHAKGAAAEAVTLIAEAARRLPASADVLSNLAMAQLACGQNADALESARRALKRAPAHPQALYFLGQAFERTGRAADSPACYAQALAIHPALHPAREALYRLVEPAGRDIQAIEATVWAAPESAAWRETLALAIRAKRAAVLNRGNIAQADVLDLVAEVAGIPQAVAGLPPVVPGVQAPPTLSRRILLIRAWGHGFWADVDHVLGQCLLAEITGRRPLVNWGENSQYGGSAYENAFDLFFEPVSDAVVADLAVPEATFFPSRWNVDNFGGLDPGAGAGEAFRLSAIHLLNREEDIVVSDGYSQILQMRRWLPAGHPMADCGLDDLYHILAKKYLRPRAHFEAEAEYFVRTHFGAAPFLAVHLRGLDKEQESATLATDNERLLVLASEAALAGGGQRVFVLTDDEDLLARARNRLGDRVVASASTRARGAHGLHFVTGRGERARLGREILLDTLIACRAERFFGLGASNVALMVRHLGSRRLPPDSPAPPQGTANAVRAGESVSSPWPPGTARLVGRPLTSVPQLMFNDW